MYILYGNFIPSYKFSYDFSGTACEIWNTIVPKSDLIIIKIVYSFNDDILPIGRIPVRKIVAKTGSILSTISSPLR